MRSRTVLKAATEAGSRSSCPPELAKRVRIAGLKRAAAQRAGLAGEGPPKDWSQELLRLTQLASGTAVNELRAAKLRAVEETCGLPGNVDLAEKRAAISAALRDPASARLQIAVLETGQHDGPLTLLLQPQPADGIEDEALPEQALAWADAARLALHDLARRELDQPTDVLVVFVDTAAGADHVRLVCLSQATAESEGSGPKPDWLVAAAEGVKAAISPSDPTLIICSVDQDASGTDMASRQQGSAALGKTLDNLIGQISLGARPVEAARVSALVPMQVEPEIFGSLRAAMLATIGTQSASTEGRPQCWLETDPEKTRGDAGSARPGAHYFLPHVQKLLVPAWNDLLNRAGQTGKAPTAFKDPAALDERIISIVRDLDHRPGDGSKGGYLLRVSRLNWPKPIDAHLTDVRLHFYCRNVMALEWTVEFPDLRDAAPREGADGELRPLWRRLLDAEHGSGVATVAAVLDHTHAQRIIFSAYMAERDETDRPCLIEIIRDGETFAQTSLYASEVDPSHGDQLPIVGVFHQLIRLAVGNALPQADGNNPVAELRRRNFGIRTDDRARVITSMVPVGERPVAGAAGRELETLEARLHMAEAYGAGWPYPEKFSRREMGRGRYDRFRKWGTHFLASDHTFAALSFAGFGLSPIHRSHVPNLYRRMALLLHLNQAVLNGFSREISTTLENWTADSDHDESDERFRSAYAKLEPALLKFTNLHWFEQVTLQVQGIELFNLMRSQGTSQAEYALIAGEIERTDRLLQRLASDEQQRRQRAEERRRQWLVQLVSLVGAFGGMASLLESGLLPTIAGFMEWFAGLVGLKMQVDQLAIAEWRFQIAALPAALFMLVLLTTGMIRVPGTNPLKFRACRPVVLFAFMMTFILPWLSTVPVSDPASRPVALALGTFWALLVMGLWRLSWPVPIMPLQPAGSDLNGVRHDAKGPAGRPGHLQRLRALWHSVRQTRLLTPAEHHALDRNDRADLEELRLSWLFFGGAAALFVLLASWHGLGVFDVTGVMSQLSAD